MVAPDLLLVRDTTIVVDHEAKEQVAQAGLDNMLVFDPNGPLTAVLFGQEETTLQQAHQ